MANPGMYRADHVGSLLRPSELATFRSGALLGEVGRRQELEDTAIKRAVALQQEIGLSIVSDGELRRHSPFSMLTDDPTGRPQVLEEVGFLQSLLGKAPGATPKPFKITLPAPSELPTQVAGRVRSTLQELIAGGVNYIQIENTGYSRCFAQSAAAELDALLSADIAAIDGLVRPTAVRLAFYVGRGSAMRAGFLDSANASFTERLFATMPVDRFVVDVDDDPSGGFTALAHVPKQKSVALGLVNPRTATLEARDDILDRLDEATGYIEGDYLAVCPQCGFADSGLSEDDQRRKLELIVSISTRYWGFEA